nr:protein cysteine N palmitoyltransferase [Hymenolepis microstoma]
MLRAILSMALSSQILSQFDKITIQMSPWGDFFVWIASHVEQLRRKHRIVGHLSTDPNGPSTNSIQSICLPLALSLEETVFLLYFEIAELQSSQPVFDLNPPSPRTLYKFDLALNQHYKESTEIFKLQKRQRTLSYYSEVLKGQQKRKERQAARSGVVTPTANESASSERSEKKRKRRKMADSGVESTADYLVDNCSSTEGVDFSIPQDPLPTLDKLISTGTKQEGEEVGLVNSIPIHRPRPTPKEWMREGEHSSLPLPFESRGSIKDVVRWLLGLSSKSRPESEEAIIIRCMVFEDLWSKGFYVTCSAAKMGGDFLVYQGDPLFYHASHIVIASPPQDPIHLSRLAASLRIANSVRKALVIATSKSNDEDQDSPTTVSYTSLYWMGSPLPSQKSHTCLSIHYSSILMNFDALKDFDFTDYDPEDFDSIEKFDYYSNGNDAGHIDPYTFYEIQQSDESFSAFFWSIVVQVWPNIWITILLCLLWRTLKGIFQFILKHVSASNHLSVVFEVLLNCASVAFGTLLLWNFFGDLYLRLCTFVFTIGLILSSLNFFSPNNSTSGDGDSGTWRYPMVLVTTCCILLQLYCEFFMDPRDWHMVRGTAMILAMKAVSASTLRVHGRASKGLTYIRMGFLRHYLSWCGYAFSPGSVIFGPWLSFDHYLQAIKFTESSFTSLLRDLLQSAVSCFIACLCIIYSTYLSSIIHSSYFLTFRWTNAYAQSQSFRFSHYFVSFFSQAMHQAIGFAAVTNPRSQHFCVTALVTNPISVELPRSLVDVVVHWNFPMHIWLKQYIYKPARRFGQLPAILLTYAFSSLLHGLNFQLAIVLFSIGIYAYIDFVLREKVAKRFDACVCSRPCSQKCNHKNKANCCWVRVVNLFFSGLAIFHLAYLAVMFDTSEQQDKGYNMLHVLKKWSNLYFLSHIIAASTYLLSLLL